MLPPLSPETFASVLNLRDKLARDDLWQTWLIDTAALLEFARKRDLAYLGESRLRALWIDSLVRADEVTVFSENPIAGLVDLAGRQSCYSDRSAVATPKGEIDWSQIRLRFHPYRALSLHQLERRFGKPLAQFESIDVRWEAETPETKKLRQFFTDWDQLVTLCVSLEPMVHEPILNRVRAIAPKDAETTQAELDALVPTADELCRTIGREYFDAGRQQLCQVAETLDPNKDAHLVLRLADASFRDQLHGRLGGAMTLLQMAEVMRRSWERATGDILPEEDELGFGTRFKSAKFALQGTDRILDDRAAANQFLRRFGLDKGLRATIYVEGATELGVLRSEFDGNSAVRIVDLKGRVAEAGGRGVAFRESLRNDLQSKIFSYVLVDGDRADTIRALGKAAEDDEICGGFTISKPDFEFENFTLAELCEVAAALVQRDGSNIDCDQLQSAAEGSSSGSEFFSRLRSVPGAERLSKGTSWGAALSDYAAAHPRGEEWGGSSDRPINRLFRWIYQASSFPYETTRQNFRVHPSTGEPVRREKPNLEDR